MALEDYIRETRALIKSFRDHADALEKHLQTTLSLHPAGVLKGGQPVRRLTTRKTADDIERLLDHGAKTMKRDELIQILVEQRLVGGKDNDRRKQYANEAIRHGLSLGYLSENSDGAVHWVPNKRRSRMGKNVNEGRSISA
jgi:hypothetical protein